MSGFAIAALIIGVMLVVIWPFVKNAIAGHGEAAWAARASGALSDLYLDVRKLPTTAKAKYFRESSALYQATTGKFDHRRFAMRFFGWYMTEYSGTDIRAFTVEGAASSALPIMRMWAQKQPELRDAAESEIKRIGSYLYAQLDRMQIPEEQKVNAQLALLELMGADPKGSPFP